MLKSLKILKMVGIAALASCIIAGTVCGIYFGVKTDNLYNKLEEQIVITENYNNYYQEGLNELDKMKANGIVSNEEYINMKNRLKSVDKYIDQLPEEERAKFETDYQAYKDNKTRAIFYPLVIILGIGGFFGALPLGIYAMVDTLDDLYLSGEEI